MAHRRQYQSSAQGSIIDYYRQMWHAPVVAMLGLLFAALPGDNAFLIGIPFTLLWVLSPAVAWYVSQSAETEDRLFVSRARLVRTTQDRASYLALLRDLRDTAGKPPAAGQFPGDAPEPIVASRTSPTNIGVYLLSVISARQFGWISFADTLERIENDPDR